MAQTSITPLTREQVLPNVIGTPVQKNESQFLDVPTTLTREEQHLLIKLLIERVKPGAILRRTTRSFDFDGSIYKCSTVWEKTEDECIPTFYAFDDFFMITNREMEGWSGKSGIQYLEDLSTSIENYQDRIFKGVESELAKRLGRHVLLCGHNSAVPHRPVNSYTAFMIAAMQHQRELIKDGIVVDAGCGRNPPLSLVAGHRLGAKRVVMLENDDMDLHIAQRLVSQMNIEKNPFRLRCCDLTNVEQMHSLCLRLSTLDRKIIVLVNIGPWKFYGKANEMALEYFGSLPNLGLLLNCGYLFTEEEDHTSAYRDAQDQLESLGLNVTSRVQQQIGLIEARRIGNLSIV